MEVARLEDMTPEQRRLILALLAQTPKEEQMAVASLERFTTAGIQAAVVDVTPDLAGRLLGNNTGNRNVRPTVVSRYARDMATGAWQLNGETVKVDVNDRVIDGQHRLMAVIESGVTVRMLVVYGLPAAAQETVDRGIGRNVADALRLRGEQNVNILAGAICQSVVLKSPTPSMNATYWPSTSGAIQYLIGHPSIRESVPLGERARSIIGYPSSTAAALHHIFAEIDQEDADTFWQRVMDGVDLPQDSAILRLREVMLKELTATRRMPRHRLQAISIKAWNAWRRGDPVALLKWKTGGSKPEAWPRPQ